MLTTVVGLPRSAEATARPGSAAPRANRDLRWITGSACPPDWWAHVERCGGGFFHTPPGLGAGAPAGEAVFAQLDRKSTRLNSSHRCISYAVFCLKKKKKEKTKSS